MEQTRNKEDAMRENVRQNTEERTVQKSKTPFRLQKIDHWNFDSVWAKKKTDTEMKKKKVKKKEANKNEIKNKRERRKMS